MIIKKLEVAGLRVFEQADFDFQPGMNLLVGVNGVGKTTVLDALRFGLSRIFPETTASRNRKEPILESDIRIGSESVKISCNFELNEQDYILLIHKQKEEGYLVEDSQSGLTKEFKTPDIEKITPPLASQRSKLKSAKNQPLGLYFSTRRSLAVDKSSSSAQGEQAGAFSDAFSINRDFNTREIADWIKVQEVLAKESPRASMHLEAIRTAATMFLSEYKNLHVVTISGDNHLMIEKNGIPQTIKQLSDGQRGMLSLALDLARRLSQLNMNLDDPVKDGQGIILIDEIDLHLHPKWQRMVVNQLTSTFQNCQFIVTSHSPQVIGEVPPERITIIDQKVYKPASSLGVDSNRILEEIMGTPSRNIKSKKSLSELFELIDREELDLAKDLLVKIKDEVGSGDPDIIRAQTLISFLED